MLGPYDDTCRFYKYIVLAKLAEICSDFSLTINAHDHLSHNMSFTYSKDVSAIILRQLSKSEKSIGYFNVACAEGITLQQLVQHFQPNLDLVKILDHKKGEGHARSFYPSVNCGQIDVIKCQTTLLETS